MVKKVTKALNLPFKDLIRVVSGVHILLNKKQYPVGKIFTILRNKPKSPWEAATS